MKIERGGADPQEEITRALRALYNGYGYLPYKMSKFEEYDLYSRNKDFLISDGVITFTDTNGKLMALKPDVTLSIIKNNADLPEVTQKLYYNENVYRISKGAGTFREILQTGLECIGAVDDYCVSEVLWLAAESLAEIAPGYVLEVSQLDLLNRCVERVSPAPAVREALLRCVAEKNGHGVAALCAEHGIPAENAAPLLALMALYGASESVLPRLRALAAEIGAEQEADALARAVSVFRGTAAEAHVQIDFSAVSDGSYYNGIVFKGFLEGVPGSVLSGGQYDHLMRRMNRRSRAIGFAVYLDQLDRIGGSAPFDVDLALIYGESADPAALRRFMAEQAACGKRTYAAARPNPKLRARQTAVFRNGEVVFDGGDA